MNPSTAEKKPDEAPVTPIPAEEPFPHPFRPKGFHVPDDVHNAWDIAFKFLSAIAAIAVFIYGIYSYTRTTADSYKAEFWKKQLEVYSTLSDTAGLLAMSDDPAKRAEAEAAFWHLYNGKARLFIESNVDRQMTGFAAALRAYGQSETPDRSELVYYSLELALACRASLSRAWDVELGPITQQEQSFH